MTTDTLEKPAETEEKVTQTEGEPDSTSDSEAEGGEDSNQGSDTKVTPSADDALQSFLKERDLAPETEGSNSEQKPKDSLPAPQVLDEAEVQRRVEAEREADRRASESEGIRTAFGNRTQNLRIVLERANVPAETREWVIGEFNAHHAQSGRVASEDARRELSEAIRGLHVREAEKYIPDIKEKLGKEINSTAQLFAAIAEGARKGHVSERDAKTRINAELVAYKKHLEKLGVIPGSKAVPDGEDNAATGNRKPTDVLDDPNATAEQLQKAFKQQYGIDFPA